MTPYEIDVLLWYYTRGCDHPDMESNPPIWRPTVDLFKTDELLTVSANSPNGIVYVLTERGELYCKALTQVPLPRQTWTVDWPTEVQP